MRTVAVIGLGLIGGSFARANKAAGLRVLGIDCCEIARQTALAVNAVDEVSADIRDAAIAQEIMIAAPVGAYEQIFTQLESVLSASTVVFDSGSCKKQILDLATRILGDKARRFIPSHPVTGSENSGIAASSESLFSDKWVVLCPQNNVDDDALAAAQTAWRRVGSKISLMTAEDHDDIFATVSHLPHILSYALVETVRANSQCDKMLDYAAGGFRDFTRIASSHPIMWRDICLQNKPRLLAAIGEFRQQLDDMEMKIKQGDSAGLEEKFTHARQLRRQWLERQKLEQS